MKYGNLGKYENYLGNSLGSVINLGNLGKG